MPLSKDTLDRINKQTTDHGILGVRQNTNVEQLKEIWMHFEEEFRGDEPDRAQQDAWNKFAAAYQRELRRVRLRSLEETAPIEHKLDATDYDATDHDAAPFDEDKTPTTPKAAKPLEAHVKSHYGDNAQVLEDYKKGLPQKKETRQLTKQGGMKFSNQDALNKFIDYQCENKREFAFSINIERTGKYNKYHPHIMGFRDGSKYEGNLDEINQKMKAEQQELQDQLAKLRKVHDGFAEGRPERADVMKQIAEQNEKIVGYEEKIRKVDTFMKLDGEYKPENNRPTKAVAHETPKLPLGEVARSGTEAEKAKKIPSEPASVEKKEEEESHSKGFSMT